MLIESRPWLRGTPMGISDRTLDALIDHLLADDSREIGRSIGALVWIEWDKEGSEIGRWGKWKWGGQADVGERSGRGGGQGGRKLRKRTGEMGLGKGR